MVSSLVSNVSFSFYLFCTVWERSSQLAVTFYLPISYHDNHFNCLLKSLRKVYVSNRYITNFIWFVKSLRERLIIVGKLEKTLYNWVPFIIRIKLQIHSRHKAASFFVQLCWVCLLKLSSVNFKISFCCL